MYEVIHSTPSLQTRTAPIEEGERLATFARSDSEEIRVTWSAFKGKPFLSVRMWTRSTNGQWWPDGKRGISVRRHELHAFAEALAGAVARSDARADSADTRSTP